MLGIGLNSHSLHNSTFWFWEKVVLSILKELCLIIRILSLELTILKPHVNEICDRLIRVMQSLCKLKPLLPKAEFFHHLITVELPLKRGWIKKKKGSLYL